jgi:hypothetical protein
MGVSYVWIHERKERLSMWPFKKKKERMPLEECRKLTIRYVSDQEMRFIVFQSKSNGSFSITLDLPEYVYVTHVEDFNHVLEKLKESCILLSSHQLFQIEDFFRRYKHAG